MREKIEYVWLTVILVALVLLLSGIKQVGEKYYLQVAEAEKLRLLEEEKQRVMERNLKFATDQVAKIATSTEEVETWIKTESIDPWGTKIAIRFKDGTFHKGDVVCAGPDKVFDTSDDITESRVNYSAVNVGVGIGKSGTNLTKGIFNRVKESLFQKDKK